MKIIAMTSFQEEELVRRAFEAGAISYLMKDVSLENLEAAIRAAYHGEPTLLPGGHPRPHPSGRAHLPATVWPHQPRAAGAGVLVED